VGRGRAVVAAVAIVAFAAVLVVAAFQDARSHDPAQVAEALRAHGLDVQEVRLDGYAGLAAGGAVLMPRDGAFTVVVYGTDDQARDAFRQYETTITDADTFDTFELRSGNVLILADFSNADQPLPSETRDRIRRAVAALEAK